MNTFASDILRNINFKGTHQLESLPDLIKDDCCCHPDCYLLQTSEKIYFSIMIMDRNVAIIFNPACEIVDIPMVIQDYVSNLYHMILIQGDFIINHDYIWYACIYFSFYSCTKQFNTEFLKALFPKGKSYTQHWENIKTVLSAIEPQIQSKMP